MRLILPYQDLLLLQLFAVSLLLLLEVLPKELQVVLQVQYPKVVFLVLVALRAHLLLLNRLILPLAHLNQSPAQMQQDSILLQIFPLLRLVVQQCHPSYHVLRQHSYHYGLFSSPWQLRS